MKDISILSPEAGIPAPEAGIALETRGLGQTN